MADLAAHQRTGWKPVLHQPLHQSEPHDNYRRQAPGGEGQNGVAVVRALLRQGAPVEDSQATTRFAEKRGPQAATRRPAKSAGSRPYIRRAQTSTAMPPALPAAQGKAPIMAISFTSPPPMRKNTKHTSIKPPHNRNPNRLGPSPIQPQGSSCSADAELYPTKQIAQAVQPNRRQDAGIRRPVIDFMPGNVGPAATAIKANKRYRGQHRRFGALALGRVGRRIQVLHAGVEIGLDFRPGDINQENQNRQRNRADDQHRLQADRAFFVLMHLLQELLLKGFFITHLP